MQVNFYLSGDKTHDYVIQSLYEGCPEDKQLRDVKEYEPSDVAVVFGVYKKAVDFSKYRGKVIEEQKKLKKDTIVLETGYIKRGDGPENYYAAGFNGLNGRADFKNENSPSDRFEKLGIELSPWTLNEHGKILLCGQVPWDASVQNINMADWILDMAHIIQQVTRREISFRPHPLAKLPSIRGLEYSTEPPEEAIRKSFAVVTYNSNTAVESVIEGVPAFSFDPGSMAYEVTSHDISDLRDPYMPDRTQWANNLAYAQWTPDEMRKGETWRHLFL